MPTVRSIELARLDYALVGDFKFFKSGRRPTLLVRLTDSDGTQGCGQAVPVETWTYETAETVESTLERYLAPDNFDGSGRQRAKLLVRPSGDAA